MVIQLEKGTLGGALKDIGPILGEALKQRAQYQQDYAKSLQKQQLSQEKQLADTYKLATSYASQFNFKDLQPEDFEKIALFSQGLQQKGTNPNQATLQALKAYGQNDWEDQFSRIVKSPMGTTLDSVTEERAYNTGTTPVQQAAQKIGAGLPTFSPTRDVDEYYIDELQQISTEQFKELPKDQKLRYVQRIQELNPYVRGGINALTFGGSEKAISAIEDIAQQKTGKTSGLSLEAIKQMGGEGAFKAGEITGDIAKFILFDKGVSKALGMSPKLAKFAKPSTLLGRTIKSGTIFGTYGQLNSLLTNKKIEPENFVRDFLVGAVTHGAFEGTSKLGSSIGKNIRLATKKAKLPKSQTANLLKSAEQEGISLDKVYNGNKEEAKKLTDYLNRVTKENPSLINERIKRVGESGAKRSSETFEKAGTRYAEGPEGTRSEQLSYGKRTPTVRAEIAAEEARLAEKARPRVKRPETIARESTIKETAKKSLPQAQRELIDFQKALNETSDALRVAKKTNVSSSQLEKIQNDYDRLKSLKKEAQEKVKQFKVESKTGTPYLTEKSIDQKAFQDAENILERVKTKSEGEILKENDLDKIVQQITGRRTIPGQGKIQEDTFDRIQRIYSKQYERKLQEIQDQLKFSELSSDKRKELQKAEDILSKLIEQKGGRYRVGRRRKGLQEMGETIKKAEEFPQRVSKASETERLKSAKKIFNRFDKTEKQIRKATTDFENGIPKNKTVGLIDLNNSLRNTFEKDYGLKINRRTASFILKTAGITGAYNIKKIANVYRGLKMLSMDPREKSLYLKELRDNEVSPASIKKSKSLSEKFKKTPILNKLFEESI